MASMNEVPDGFALPAGKTLVFAPGGNHIMLTGLTGALKEGDFADIVLTFAKAGPVTLHMPVRDAPFSDDSAGAMSGMKM
jgi:copper(I)-binding protein